MKIVFFIGKYEDEVLCDVMPMNASHILLRHHWQYDKKATHYRFFNRYSFIISDKPVILKPLTLKKVYKDQKVL